MTKKQVGAYEWNFECNRIRQSSTAIGESLLKIIESNPGPQTLYALVARGPDFGASCALESGLCHGISSFRR